MIITIDIEDELYHALQKALPSELQSVEKFLGDMLSTPEIRDAFMNLNNPGLSEVYEDFLDSFDRTHNAIESTKTKDSPFNEFGLRHSITYLNSIQDEIPFWELEKQAEFADQLTSSGHFYENPDFLVQLVAREAIRKDFKNWNTTSIGNLAYIALHASNPEISKVTKEILEEYKDYVRNKLK